MLARMRELRDAHARLIEQGRARLAEIKDDTKKEDRARIESEVDAMFDEAEGKLAEYRRLEKIVAGEAAQAAMADAQTRAARPDLPNGQGGAVATVAKPEYRAVFVDALRYGYAGLTEEQRAVFHENAGLVTADKMAPEMRALAAGTDSAGGYTVPEGFIPEIEKTLALWGPMQNGNVIRLLTTDSGNALPYPTVDDTASRGELQAENAAATDDGGNDFVFGVNTLSAYMYNSEIMRVPVQLLTDSAFNFETMVVPDLFGERMARTANAILTTGTGSSQPQGIVTGSALGVTATSATAVTADELIDHQHKIDPAYRQDPSCGWMFNDTFLKGIRKLKDSEGRYIWQRPDLALGTPGTLLDKPYHLNQAMADPAASAKAAVFGALNRFITRQVGRPTIFVFREKYMNQLQLGFMAFSRIDGRCINSGAIKHLKMAAS